MCSHDITKKWVFLSLSASGCSEKSRLSKRARGERARRKMMGLSSSLFCTILHAFVPHQNQNVLCLRYVARKTQTPAVRRTSSLIPPRGTISNGVSHYYLSSGLSIFLRHFPNRTLRRTTVYPRTKLIARHNSDCAFESAFVARSN
jgi:hypothetical protein